MGSGKERFKGKPLGPKTTKLKADSHSGINNKNKNKKQQRPNKNTQNENQIGTQNSEDGNNKLQPASPSAQLNSFLDKFQSANRLQLSSLELDSLTDKCIVDLSGSTDQDVENLGKHVKAAFGPSWKAELCDKRLLEGKVDPGSPAVLIISTSALRSIELLRGFRSLTKECHPVKLFSKHMKVDEQVSLLKDRVNIASGTPSRIKKLIDIEALGLSRLSVIVLDVHPDVKGYSLLTLPQVRDEFWDLYKTYFHQRLLQGSLRLSLYGPLISDNEFKGKKKRPNE
ncbi:putative P-loop containing nucleoside triphosphate hydrolase, protein Cms1 [Rosa chinensis]|uniref:Putative P-loop containing nucleoside triphosphate hydrolase, protein Cms1 n=1 Tax=Rosa chinensis TaxID=74649 RepID=A0A2P6QV20_ROSCH|nr:protein CMSS1 [Rosa chinensis]PRQ38032.1 putative P-loop containing nucleoside triphosphate hydrolase, protein Cms1 [Rosa chinensis]